jgi:type III secretion protein L
MGLAFLISTDHLTLLGERKVLKEAEYSALLDATSVVKVARQEAGRSVEQAAHEADAARERGYAEGVERARSEQALQLLSEAVRTERQLQGLRVSMARIVARAVEQFVSEIDPSDLLEAALQRVDALIREEPFVTVHVAPAQEQALRAALSRLSPEMQPWLRKTRVVTDSALEDDGCVLQTPSGTLAIGMNAQLDAFRAALERNGLVFAEETP